MKFEESMVEADRQKRVAEILSADKSELIEKIHDLKNLVTESLPSSRESSLVQTKLDEALFWAIDSITKHGTAAGNRLKEQHAISRAAEAL